MVTVFALDSLSASTSVAQQLSHKYDVKARMHALHCVRAWAAKGYQPVYLSGRQGSYYNLTLVNSLPNQSTGCFFNPQTHRLSIRQT